MGRSNFCAVPIKWLHFLCFSCQNIASFEPNDKRASDNLNLQVYQLVPQLAETATCHCHRTHEQRPLPGQGDKSCTARKCRAWPRSESQIPKNTTDALKSFRGTVDKLKYALSISDMSMWLMNLIITLKLCKKHFFSWEIWKHGNF